jgi:hypothetical protein
VVSGGANRLASARRVAALAVGGSDQIFERVNTVWRAGGEREREINRQYNFFEFVG